MNSDQYHQNLYLIVNCLLNKAPIKEDLFKSINADNNYLQCIYRLLSLHYNFEVDDRYQINPDQTKDKIPAISQQLRVIGQILKAIGLVITVPNASKKLIEFDYGKFNQICQQNKFQALIRKSKGLYPYMAVSQQNRPIYVPYYDQIESFAHIGNPKWQFSRKALKAWHQQAKGLSADQDLAYLILLADEDLECRVSGHFNQIWAQLYIFYVQHTLQPYRSHTPLPAIEFLQISTLLSNIKQIMRSIKDEHEQICFLVISMLNRINVKQSSLECFRRAFDKLFQKQNWLILSLMQSLGLLYPNLQRMLLQNKTKYCEKLKNSKNPSHLKYYFKIFLTDEEIIEYCISSQTIPECPGIKPDSKLIETVAIRILDQQPQISGSVIKYLSRDTFADVALKSKAWRERLYAQETIATINLNLSNYVSVIAHNIKENETSIKTDLQRFCHTWELYHQATEEKDLNLLYNFMKSSQIMYCKELRDYLILPFEEGDLVFKVLKIFAEQLIFEIEEEEKKSNGQIGSRLSQFCKITLEPWFIDLIKVLEEGELKQFWYLWSQIFMRDDELISQLLQGQMNEMEIQ